MPYKSHVAIAVLVAALAVDKYKMRKLKKSHDVLEEITEIFGQMVRDSDTRMAYLVNLIDRSDIELSEFDLIAISNAIA